MAAGLALTIAAGLMLAGCGAARRVPAPAGVAGSWHLVLDSEFHGSSLDTSLWRPGWFGTRVTGIADDRQRACFNARNVRLSGAGTLDLAVTDQPSRCGGHTEPYTGALISTNPDDGRAGGGFQYTYGVLEARVDVPAAGPLIADWPAVWTDGQHWPSDGEDDLMEGLGGQACFHFHDSLGAPGQCDQTITPGWHTFASDWQPGSVTYYYDGTRVGTITTGITKDPMYIVLDDTVSADAVPRARPSRMRIAWVRVWQR